MTDLNNTNADDERTNPTPNDDAAAGASSRGRSGDPAKKADLGNLDEAWAAFEAEHRDELDAVASSRNAKRFQKHAERKEKETLLHVSDLDPNAFSRTGPSHGPRDFTGSSWLDTDAVMDSHDDGGFTPPNPEIGPMRHSTVVCWILLAVGLLGMIATVLVPAFSAVPVLGWLLGFVFNICTVLGLGGLIVKVLNRRRQTGDRGGYFDDGARV
ncbi:hypothetical protein [Bifidobacterium platyrrhinorum]|uniref:Membrane associated protein n=1 Tax=Bifidobacterium platyrrhinorum TaxID=2661628 RepID=A0A6L9SSI7_9BIFI|nr:hypothetical protein [Bifidobacterium platyrrhinorum]NEG54472.1 hypothetical protein [Bifidobacterium platyrrhinorum]